MCIRDSVEIAAALAGRAGREPKTFEYQMLYGIRPDEQQRIADRGDQMLSLIHI